MRVSELLEILQQAVVAGFGKRRISVIRGDKDKSRDNVVVTYVGPRYFFIEIKEG